MVATLCFIFVVVGGVLIGFALVDALMGFIFDREHGPNNVVPHCAGTLLVINDGEEIYLFLDTDKKPEEFTKYKEVVFRVETRK